MKRLGVGLTLVLAMLVFGQEPAKPKQEEKIAPAAPKKAAPKRDQIGRAHV